MTLPQVRGMYHGDRSRKQVLVDYGFRLPSALDNRPLTYEEFRERLNQVIAVSATPGPEELERAGGEIVEQVIRPTGLVDPAIEVRPVKGQVDDLLAVVRETAAAGERVLVTTLTKRMAEELTNYFTEVGVRCRYLHSDIEIMERVDDPVGLPPRRLRLPDRHQPAARGPRPARGGGRRDPRRRQGGLPAQRDVARSRPPAAPRATSTAASSSTPTP